MLALSRHGKMRKGKPFLNKVKGGAVMGSFLGLVAYLALMVLGLMAANLYMELNFTKVIILLFVFSLFIYLLELIKYAIVN